MNLYRRLDRLRVQFDFISYSSEECHYDSEIRELGGRIIHLPHSRSLAQIKDVSAIVHAICVFGPYQAVHAHTMFNSGLVMLAAHRCKVPRRIAHSHNTAESHQSSTIRKGYARLMRKIILTNATDYLACSQGAAEFLFGKNATKSDKYHYFPNAVDFLPFLQLEEERESVRKELGIDKDALVIGSIGKLSLQKNIAFLLQLFPEILKRHPGAYLLLVGDGPLRAELVTQAQSLRIADKVTFAGVRPDVPRMLRAMDIFILPSIFEGLGIVLLEAQAAGLPCVVSEAIQPEADLGLGLFTRLSLDSANHRWCAAVTDALRMHRPSRKEIERAIDSTGMNIQMTTKQLLGIYGIPEA